VPAVGRRAKPVMGPWSHTGTTGYLSEVNFGMAASTELMGVRGRFAEQLGRPSPSRTVTAHAG
jgi:hypothetical protein